MIINLTEQPQWSIVTRFYIEVLTYYDVLFSILSRVSSILKLKNFNLLIDLLLGPILNFI